MRPAALLSLIVLAGCTAALGDATIPAAKPPTDGGSARDAAPAPKLGPCAQTGWRCPEVPADRSKIPRKQFVQFGRDPVRLDEPTCLLVSAHLMGLGPGYPRCRYFARLVERGCDAGTIHLDLVLPPPSPDRSQAGLCRALSMASGETMVGPLAPGAWRIAIPDVFLPDTIVLPAIRAR